MSKNKEEVSWDLPNISWPAVIATLFTAPIAWYFCYSAFELLQVNIARIAGLVVTALIFFSTFFLIRKRKKMITKTRFTILWIFEFVAIIAFVRLGFNYTTQDPTFFAIPVFFVTPFTIYLFIERTLFKRDFNNMVERNKG